MGLSLHFKATKVLVDPALWTLYKQRCASEDQKGNLQRDPRLLEARLQDGYTLHLYWAGVVRAWFARAQRDARRLRTPLYWVRSAYEITGLDSLSQEVKMQVQKQLMRTYNIHYTAHLHPTMLLHAGQRLKLTEKISAEDRTLADLFGPFTNILNGFKSFYSKVLILIGKLIRQPPKTIREASLTLWTLLPPNAKQQINQREAGARSDGHCPFLSP